MALFNIDGTRFDGTEAQIEALMKEAYGGNQDGRSSMKEARQFIQPLIPVF